MDVKALIVGRGVLDVMLNSPHMGCLCEYNESETIHQIGLYGAYPVYWDESLADNKLMVSYTQHPGGSEPDQAMVKRWRDQLPSHPDGDGWILLTQGREPYQGSVERETNWGTG